ncbi:Uncharacterised protein [Enterobacter cloacae]|nr:Uncharacterised protein [Enterobacter cloacae]
MVERGHCRFKYFCGVCINAVVFIDIAINIRGAVCQTLGQMQFKIRKAARVQTTTESIDRRFADARFLCQSGDA